MGLLDHFRHSRSSSQPPPSTSHNQPFQYDTSPAPGPWPSQNHYAQPPAYQQQPLTPPQPTAPLSPQVLHLSFDSWSARSGRFTTHPDPDPDPDHSPPPLYTWTSHLRNPQLRFFAGTNSTTPFATVAVHIAQHLTVTIHSATITIPAHGWNVWEYAYASPALGGRRVKWTTPEGPYGDKMVCVFEDSKMPVGRWMGAMALGKKGAGRLEIVPELVGERGLVEEMTVVGLGLWWLRLQTRSGGMA